MNWLFFLDLISIALKCSHLTSFVACDSLQFAHFVDMWKQDSVDLFIKHICILISWFFAHNLHFAIVFLQVLMRCSNSGHLWHWLIRLFKNFVTCKNFSFTNKSFLIVLSASFLNFKLIFTDECVLFSRFSVRVHQIDWRASVKSLYVSISFWNSCIESLYKAISTSCTICSNYTSFSWIDLNENSLSQIDWHWISWFAVFFFETVKTMLFFCSW